MKWDIQVKFNIGDIVEDGEETIYLSFKKDEYKNFRDFINQFDILYVVNNDDYWKIEDNAKEFKEKIMVECNKTEVPYYDFMFRNANREKFLEVVNTNKRKFLVRDNLLEYKPELVNLLMNIKNLNLENNENEKPIKKIDERER